MNNIKPYNIDNLSEEYIIIYVDGSCNWKNKCGGYGVLLLYKDQKKTLSGGEQDTTISRMELMAMITALRNIKKGFKTIIYSDSEYVVNCINKNWLKDWSIFKLIKKNQDLLDIYWELYQSLDGEKNIKIKHIRGHQGILGNEEADKLAKSEYYRMKNLLK